MVDPKSPTAPRGVYPRLLGAPGSRSGHVRLARVVASLHFHQHFIDQDLQHPTHEMHERPPLSPRASASPALASHPARRPHVGRGSYTRSSPNFDRPRNFTGRSDQYFRCFCPHVRRLLPASRRRRLRTAYDQSPLLVSFLPTLQHPTSDIHTFFSHLVEHLPQTSLAMLYATVLAAALPFLTLAQAATLIKEYSGNGFFGDNWNFQNSPDTSVGRLSLPNVTCRADPHLAQHDTRSGAVRRPGDCFERTFGVCQLRWPCHHRGRRHDQPRRRRPSQLGPHHEQADILDWQSSHRRFHSQ